MNIHNTSLPNLLRHNWYKLNRQFASELKRHRIEIAPQEYSAIRTIYESGDEFITESYLKKQLGVHANTITQICKKLINKNLITKELSTKDRRCVVICLTKKGDKVFIDAEPIARKLKSKIQLNFHPDEIETLRKTLLKVISNLEEI